MLRSRAVQTNTQDGVSPLVTTAMAMLVKRLLVVPTPRMMTTASKTVWMKTLYSLIVQPRSSKRSTAVWRKPARKLSQHKLLRSGSHAIQNQHANSVFTLRTDFGIEDQQISKVPKNKSGWTSTCHLALLYFGWRLAMSRCRQSERKSPPRCQFGRGIDGDLQLTWWPQSSTACLNIGNGRLIWCLIPLPVPTPEIPVVVMFWCFCSQNLQPGSVYSDVERKTAKDSIFGG